MRYRYVLLAFALAAHAGIAGSSGAAVLFQNDVESASTCRDVFAHDVNSYGGGACSITTEYAHSGTHAIRLAYPADEAGVELQPEPFQSTQTLFTRKYEYYPSAWSGDWPVGLKTSRYFAQNNFSFDDGGAYMSEKLMWQSYSVDYNPPCANNCNCPVVPATNEAIGSPHGDYVTRYTAGQLFGNGLPYLRTNHWYKFETWMVMNSGVDVHDGILRIWIDDVLVVDRSDMDYRNSNATGNYSGWQSMWFGGNYSNGGIGGCPSNPHQTLYRYIDDVYLSTSLDRGQAIAPPAAPAGLMVN